MRIFIPALALILILFAATCPAQEPPLFVVSQDFAPYSMLVDGRPSGIDVDVITEAGRRAGIPFNIEVVPLDKMTSMLKAGQCEAAVGLFTSPERKQYGVFLESTPVHKSDYVLFTKVGSDLEFGTYEDLSGTIIGRVNGTDLGPEFDKAVADNLFDAKDYPDLAAALTGLLKGEIDGYAGNIDVTYARLKDMGMTSSIVYLPKKIIIQRPAYLVFSRASGYPDLAQMQQKLEIALDRMIKDGSYNKIARHYLLRF